MKDIPVIIHYSWHPYIEPLFDLPNMIKLRNEILPNCKFYPIPQQIFRVLEMPLDKIKVVILGQDFQKYL